MSFKEEYTGKSGERRIYHRLLWAHLRGYKGLILRNVYLPKGGNKTSESDLIFITAKGIIVIESKNYSGYIYGSENSEYWLVSLNKGVNYKGKRVYEKHRLYNPLRQNKAHVRYLRKYLNEDIKTYSLIVFSERCELRNIKHVLKDTYVIKRHEIIKCLKEIYKNEDVLSEEKMKEIYEKLLPLTKVSDEVKDKHVEDVRRYYK